MTRTDAPRYACHCASPAYHQTGNPRCMVSILLAALQDQGAALLPADPSAAVQTEPLPDSGDPGPWELLDSLVATSSQKEVAERYGISPQYLCDILAKRREISASVAAALGYAREVVFRRLEP